MNNQNQEEFIVIIINYTFNVFLVFLLCKKMFLKNTDPKNHFYFADQLTQVFFAVLPVDQKN